MRVIAGKAKGHKLKTIEGLQTRPTTDRMKETLLISLHLICHSVHFWICFKVVVQ